MISPRNQS